MVKWSSQFWWLWQNCKGDFINGILRRYAWLWRRGVTTPEAYQWWVKRMNEMLDINAISSAGQLFKFGVMSKFHHSDKSRKKLASISRSYAWHWSRSGTTWEGYQWWGEAHKQNVGHKCSVFHWATIETWCLSSKYCGSDKGRKKYVEQNEKKKIEQERKMTQREIVIKMKAFDEFVRYLQAWKPETLPKKAKDAKAILWFVLTILALYGKISNFNTGLKALKWLSRFPA